MLYWNHKTVSINGFVQMVDKQQMDNINVKINSLQKRMNKKLFVIILIQMMIVKEINKMVQLVFGKMKNV